jgi:hypothetical protein
MNTTLVTCYYKLHKSKHTHEEYNKWINNFISNLRTNIVIYTSSYHYEYIHEICSKNKNLNYKIIIKEIDNFNIVKNHPDIWENQEQIDPNKRCGRGKGCYIIWNSKFDLIKETIEMNPFNSDNYIWNDIGNVRDSNIIPYLTQYPNGNNISNNKIDIVVINGFKNDNQMFFQDEVHFSGSMFGGSKEILLEIHKLYYLYFNMYLRKGLFIGCDQQIISSVFLRNRDKFNCIIPNNTIDPWFHLYVHYS